MKLRDFFKKQAQVKLSEEDKLVIYDLIKSRIGQETIFRRFSFYAKIAIYSLFLLFTFFGFFYTPTKKLDDGIKLSSRKNNVVMANYIGKILTSTGGFSIYQQGKKIETNVLQDGDILNVSKRTHLTVKVNSGINLYIVGPAKIKLQKYTNFEGKNVYILDMLDGDYLSVKSNIANDKIIIKAKYLDIESDNKEIDLKYVKEGNATIVENNGGNIIVKNKQRLLTLGKKEKLILSDSDKQLIKNIFNDNYKKYQITSSGLKIILTSSQLERLSNIWDKKLTIIAVGKYVLGKLNNDKKWYNNGKMQLIHTLFNTYSILELKIPKLIQAKFKTNTLNEADLENLIDNLISNTSAKYILPHYLIERWKVVLAYLVIIEKVNLPEGKLIPNLSYLLDYVNLPLSYKKKLLAF